MGKWQVGEATIFLENLKILNILSRMLDINIKCSERLAPDQNF